MIVYRIFTLVSGLTILALLCLLLYRHLQIERIKQQADKHFEHQTCEGNNYNCITGFPVNNPQLNITETNHQDDESNNENEDESTRKKRNDATVKFSNWLQLYSTVSEHGKSLDGNAPDKTDSKRASNADINKDLIESVAEMTQYTLNTRAEACELYCDEKMKPLSEEREKLYEMLKHCSQKLFEYEKEYQSSINHLKRDFERFYMQKIQELESLLKFKEDEIKILRNKKFNNFL